MKNVNEESKNGDKTLASFPDSATLFWNGLNWASARESVSTLWRCSFRVPNLRMISRLIKSMFSDPSKMRWDFIDQNSHSRSLCSGNRTTFKFHREHLLFTFTMYLPRSICPEQLCESDDYSTAIVDPEEGIRPLRRESRIQISMIDVVAHLKGNLAKFDWEAFEGLWFDRHCSHTT